MTTTPMPGAFRGDDEFNQVWTRAWVHADGVVGTHHLLQGLDRVPRVAQALAAYDVTPLVLRGLVRDAAPEPGAVGRVLSVAMRPVEFSSAAAAALDRCQTRPGSRPGDERGPVDVLLAVLGDSQSRAVGILDECGVEIDQLRAALRENRSPAARPDPEAVDLRSTRDALVGHRRYRPRGFRNWLFGLLAGDEVNYAEHPVLWTGLEAGDRAHRGGRAIRSDDVLLSLLATHEVALAYPHLARGARHKYTGGQALLAAGIDYERVSAAVAVTDLGKDTLPPAGRLSDWPQDTGGLLDTLLCRDNRSSRVLAALGATSIC